MIALLTGEVVLRRTDHVVIDTGGVGYRLAVSAQTLTQVPPVGGTLTVHTHLIVRDDQMQLYGFISEDERDLFLALLSVQAVGPKVALATLSSGAPRELTAALAKGDAGRFQAVPGIGKRTAERIVVELRDKVASGHEHFGAEQGVDEDPHITAREGLIGLGFSLAEAEDALRGADGDSAEDLIASALRGSAK